MMKPILMIHGGAGNRIPKNPKIHQALKQIYENSFEYLKTHSALEAVVTAVELLEDCHFFNAGIFCMKKGIFSLNHKMKLIIY